MRTGRAALEAGYYLLRRSCLSSRRADSSLRLVLPKFCSVVADLFQVTADLLTVLKDFFFAGAIADIAS